MVVRPAVGVQGITFLFKMMKYLVFQLDRDSTVQQIPLNALLVKRDIILLQKTLPNVLLAVQVPWGHHMARLVLIVLLASIKMNTAKQFANRVIRHVTRAKVPMQSLTMDTVFYLL